MLISTILRQYFMSLKVLGKWKHWGKSMDRTFASIQTNLQNTHKLYDASPCSPTRRFQFPVHPKQPAADATTAAPDDKPRLPRNPTIDKVRQLHEREESPGASDSEADPETDEEDHADHPIRFTARELELLRRSMNKWWRLAGLKGQPKCADEMGEDELQVDWTRAIAPRLEGRIKEVSS